MQELEPSWRHVLSVWWLLVWRGLVGGFVIGFFLGGIVGLVYALMRRPELIAPVSAFVGCIGGIIWGFFVVRMALQKKYDGFRIALLSTKST